MTNKQNLCFVLSDNTKPSIYTITPNLDAASNGIIKARYVLLPDKIPVLEISQANITISEGDEDYLESQGIVSNHFMSIDLAPNACILQAFDLNTNQWVDDQATTYPQQPTHITGPETDLEINLKQSKVDLYKKHISGFDINGTKVDLAISNKSVASISVNLKDQVEYPFVLKMTPIIRDWEEAYLEYDWQMTVDKGTDIFDNIFGYYVDRTQHIGSLTPNDMVILPNGQEFSFDKFYYNCDKQYTNFTKLIISDPGIYNSDSGYLLSSSIYFDNKLLITKEYIGDSNTKVVVDNTPPLSNPLFDVNDIGKVFNVRYVVKDAVPDKI